MKILALFCLLSPISCLPLSAQTNVQAERFISTLDATPATRTAPNKTGLLASRPTACTVGDTYFSTDAAAGQNVSICTTTGAPGTWTAISGVAPCSVSAGGNFSCPGGGSFGTAGLYSGSQQFSGLTSGTVGFAANDIAGSSILYLLPVTAGTVTQVLSDNGAVTCPTLDPLDGSPVCHQLLWITPSGGGGGGSSGAIASLFTATDETTTSATFVNLATPDSVTFTLAATTTVVVQYMANGYSTGGAGVLFNSVFVDGSQADDGNQAVTQTAASFPLPSPASWLAISLGAGSHTINVEHRVNAFTGHWRDRLLLVTNGTSGTSSNCSSAASPAVCGSASAGSVTIAAAATSVVVNTTAVTANSQIFVQQDAGLGTKLSVTCYSALQTAPWITARTPGTSFTISATAPAVLPACFSYSIIN